MSSIDNRIVRMQFDNEQFERGVMQSMRTLDELNEKLQFKEAGKGISALQVHLSNVNFDGIQNAIQHINHSFTSMTGMVAQRIKEDIVDNVINAAKRLEQVTLGQIKSGGKARAQNLANARFMIEGLKYDWEAVYKAADYAVTDTAYGLDAAAKAASQLAASGVDFQETIETVNGKDLTQMHKSLRAISGVAAMTNASYDEIAHIFTAVAGMGKLTGMQLTQLSLRGLNIASTIAQETGKTEAEIRDMVSKGQISFQMFADAMDSAYGDHAKDANKTFQGSFSNLKAALSRIGAIFQQPVIDKTNTFFVSVTKRVKEFQAALNDTKALRVSEKGFKKLSEQASKAAKAAGLSGNAYDAFVKTQIESNKRLMLENKKSLENGDVEEYSISRFATHFAEAWEAAVNFASKVVETLDLSWFQSIGGFLDKAAQKAIKFFGTTSKAIDKVKAAVDKASGSITDNLELDMKDLDLLHRILYNEFGYVEERWAKLDKIYKEQGSTKTGLWLQGYMDQLAGVGYHFEKLGWTEEEFKKKQEELAKSEAQRVSGMSKEELVIAELTGLILDTRSAMEGVRKTIGNVLKSIGNLGSAIGKVLLSFRSFSAGLHPDDLTDRFARISEAIYRFTEVIQPSEEALQKIMEVSQDIGNVFDDVTEFVTNAVVAFIDFVASCLKANESLDELAKNESLTSMQRAVLNILRVINNLRRTFVALGKIVGKIFKSIKTAFQNVFGGEELGGAVAAVTGGVNLLSEGLADVAEKVAEAETPFKIIEYVFGTVFSIIHKISNALGKFTTGLRKFKNGTEDTVETSEKALKVGEKGSSFIEGLGKMAGKGFQWVSELPTKLKKLWESIKEQEGIQHLRTSIESLWKTMKESFHKGIDPMTRGMNDLAKSTGGEGDTLFGKVADGIGKVADKIASYIDKLPEYGTKIKEFFTSVKEWVNKTISDLHLSELGKGISDAFSDIFTSNDSIFVKIKNFAGSVFDTIVTELSKVDWKEVGKGGILALVAANLFNFFRATSGIAEAVEQIKKIPKNIGGIFKAVGNLFMQAEASLAKATNAYVLANAAKVILAMAAAIIMLKDIPKDDLNKALAAISFMGFIIGFLMRSVGAMMRGIGSFKDANAKVIDNSQKNLLQVNASLGRLAGVAMVMAAAGGSMWLLTKAVSMIMNLTKGGGLTSDKAGQLSAALQTVFKIAAYLAGGLGIMVVVSKVLRVDGAALAGMGAALFGISASIAAIAGVVVLISKIGVDSTAVSAAVAIVSSVILMTYVLGTVARWADPKALLALALDMIVMSFAVGIIGAELVGLTALMVVLDLAGKGDLLLVSMGVIAGIILAMGGAIALMGVGLSKMKDPKSIVTPILAMAVVIAVVGATISKVAQSAGSNLQGTAIAFFAIIAIIGMIAATIEKAVSTIRTGDSSTKAFMALAGIFAAVGVCMVLMAYAVQQMSGPNMWKGAIVGLGALIAICVAIGVITKIASKNTNAVEALSAMAIAFVAIGVSLVLIAEAAKIFGTVNLQGLIAIGAILVVLLGAFVALAVLTGKGLIDADKLKSVASAFVSFGVALLLVSAGALVFGIAVGVIAGGFGLLAAGIGVLANAFNEHKITVAVLLVTLALLAFLVHQLVKVSEPVVGVVANAANAVIDTTGKASKGLLSTLKGTGSKISSWWKGVQPKTKAMIVTGIGTLCAAILKASPQVLNTAKALLKKLIDFLIDIIPDVVHGLLEIIIKIVNALAEEIRSNSARIVYAIFNLLESLLEVVLEVLNQLIMFIFGDGKIGQTISKGITTLKGGMRAHLGEMKAYSEEANDLANKAQKDWLDISASNGSPYAKDLLDDVSAMESKLDDSTEAVKDHTDAMDTYFEAAAKGAKTRIPGIPIEVSGVDMQGKAIGGALGDGIKDGTAGSLDGMTDVFGDMMPEVGDVAGTELMDGVDGSIEDSKPELYSTTTDVVQEGPVDAIEDMEPEIRKTAREHISEILVDQVGDEGYRKMMETRMWSNGGYIMRGLAKGIDDHLYIVGDKMTQVTNMVNGNFIGPMKINSPSKVFFDNGAFLLMGLANGILANLDLVENASGEMTNTIMDTFGPSIDYVSKVASGEFEYDPTIRPVLDSSSIGRGAGAINSMFRNQNVSLSGFSGQLAADIGQLDSRNSDVVEELRALREEMSIMGEEISNMQVVMDTGALVGATAAPMDRALGRRVAYKGRGN